MRVLVILAVILGLFGCAPAESGSPSDGPLKKVQIPQDEASCKAAGATWRPVCLMGQPACVVQYADAGKTCRDGHECTGGQCRAGAKVPPDGTPATGTCVASSDPCGCFALIEDGKVSAALCVD